MSKAACRVKIDLSGLALRFSPERLRSKQAAFAERVAFEMKDYAPLSDENHAHMRDTVDMASDFEEGHVEWQTPYAQYVHDLPQSSIRTVVNPNAKSHWPEKAKEERMEAWTDFANELLRED